MQLKKYKRSLKVFIFSKSEQENACMTFIQTDKKSSRMFRS